MSIFHSFILGVVEGLTEFLPVSSTAHLIITSHLLSIAQSDEHILFEIAIQLGAISAVILMFFKKFLSFVRIKKLAFAFIPTGIAGLFIYPYLKLIFNTPIIIGFTLLVGGIIILFAEHFYAKAEREGGVEASHEITFTQAILLGCYQALAIIPGVSRSGAIIVGGLFHKMERKLLTEFTFLLAVPTMVVATAYSLYKNRDILLSDSHDTLPFLVGFVTSFLVASFVIKFFLDYIKKHSFAPFGFYRIVLGVVVIVMFL
ncbi:MAG: undecaprenyl-diphosphate phosphatase [Candidatus Pacebacteria bacterium]|nr:undecaprenyl-diphosphate phosphatase [Candidatus Paceibacterota bacterium]